MRVRIDEDLCTGCAVCEEMCPEVFQVGDDDVAHIVSDEECEEHDARDVAAECPNEAIIVEED